MSDCTLSVCYETASVIQNPIIEYSIVIPIHNQEAVVVDHLQSIITNTVGHYELILIFDACEDQTVIRAVEFLKTIPNPPPISCLTTDKSMFETSCDNIGFKRAKGIYWIEIQADMKMMTYGYNFILSKPCRLWSDVFAVSGRCCHQRVDSSQGHGKLGLKMEAPLQLKWDEMNKFYVAETCNRGPLLFVGERLKALNYLDEKNFVLSDDDHDVMARAFDFHGWVNGYMPIEFFSPSHLGNSRRPRTQINQDRLSWRRNQGDGGHLKHRKQSVQPKPIEIRIVPTYSPQYFHNSVQKTIGSQDTKSNESKSKELETTFNDTFSYESKESKDIMTNNKEHETKEMNRQFTLVTGASSNHASTLLQFVNNLIVHYQNAKHDTVRIVIYDLGLSAEQRQNIESKTNLHAQLFRWKKFKFSQYPAHARIQINAADSAQARGHYAWKPLLISEVCAEYGGTVVWMDSGNLLRKPLINMIEHLRHTGLYSFTSRGRISDWTHKDTVQKLKCQDTTKQNRNAACIGFNYEFSWVKNFVRMWTTACSQKDCIAPLGSSLENHRYDQSIFSILYYSYEDQGMFSSDNTYNPFEEYTIHNDVPETTESFLPIMEPYSYNPKTVCSKGLVYWKRRRDVYSQNGEDGIIEHLLNKLKISKGWVCEFGAADGKWNSNTYRLIESSQDWNAVYIEADEEKFKELQKLAKEKLNIHAIQCRIAPQPDHPNSLDNILVKTQILKDFDLLSIDIDSCDFQVWKSLTYYSPKIVVIEIHSGISPECEDYIHQDNVREGTSYLPMVRLGISKGYRLVCHTGNLIWIRNDLADQIDDLCEADPVLRPECYMCPDWLNEPEKQKLLLKQIYLL